MRFSRLTYPLVQSGQSWLHEQSHQTHLNEGLCSHIPPTYTKYHHCHHMTITSTV